MSEEDPFKRMSSAIDRLYDLLADSKEQTNLLHEISSQAEELKRQRDEACEKFEDCIDGTWRHIKSLESERDNANKEVDRLREELNDPFRELIIRATHSPRED